MTDADRWVVGLAHYRQKSEKDAKDSSKTSVWVITVCTKCHTPWGIVAP